MNNSPSLPDLTPGRIALRITNLERSLDFYQGALGFELLNRAQTRAVLGVNGAPLLHLEQCARMRRPARATGLYHFAILLPTRRHLAELVYHIARKEIWLDGAADHGVSEALYLSDPDGLGIELYRDLPPSEWLRDDLGRLQMVTEELDLDGLLSEMKGGPQEWRGLPAGTRIGHVHLHVADLPAAEAFYTRQIGFEVTQRLAGSAVFLAVGGYHHHLGINTWAGKDAPPLEAAGLDWFEVQLPDAPALRSKVERLQESGILLTAHESGWLACDPSQNGVLLSSASA